MKRVGYEPEVTWIYLYSKQFVPQGSISNTGHTFSFKISRSFKTFTTLTSLHNASYSINHDYTLCLVNNRSPNFISQLRANVVGANVTRSPTSVPSTPLKPNCCRGVRTPSRFPPKMGEDTTVRCSTLSPLQCDCGVLNDPTLHSVI
jgi:hypothetical protein